MKTIVTYKVSEEWIFKEVEKHSNKGGWIKDILGAFIRGELIYKTSAKADNVKD